MVARGNASNGNLLRNNNATAAAIASKADNVGQENNYRGSNDRDNDKDGDKWGRGALFNSSSFLLSLVIGHLVSNAIAAVECQNSGSK